WRPPARPAIRRDGVALSDAGLPTVAPRRYADLRSLMLDWRFSPGSHRMKRRTFCASALALASASTSSFRRVLAASSVSTEIPIIRGDGKQATLTASDVADLKGSLRGELLLPSQSGYDQA